MSTEPTTTGLLSPDSGSFVKKTVSRCSPPRVPNGPLTGGRVVSLSVVRWDMPRWPPQGGIQPEECASSVGSQSAVSGLGEDLFRAIEGQIRDTCRFVLSAQGCEHLAQVGHPDARNACCISIRGQERYCTKKRLA